MLLALSVGLNVGLLFDEVLEARHAPRPRRADYKNVEHNEQDIIDRRMLQLEELGLTGEQKDRIQAVLNEFVPRIAARNREFEQLREEIARECASESVDAARVRQLVHDMNAVHAARDSLAAVSLQGEADVLDADQLRRFARSMIHSRSHKGDYGRTKHRREK